MQENGSILRPVLYEDDLVIFDSKNNELIVLKLKERKLVRFAFSSGRGKYEFEQADALAFDGKTVSIVDFLLQKIVNVDLIDNQVSEVTIKHATSNSWTVVVSGDSLFVTDSQFYNSSLFLVINKRNGEVYPLASDTKLASQLRRNPIATVGTLTGNSESLFYLTMYESRIYTLDLKRKQLTFKDLSKNPLKSSGVKGLYSVAPKEVSLFSGSIAMIGDEIVTQTEGLLNLGWRELKVEKNSLVFANKSFDKVRVANLPKKFSFFCGNSKYIATFDTETNVVSIYKTDEVRKYAM
jgi:hypothetical protein